jgi:hypothetical protein
MKKLVRLCTLLIFILAACSPVKQVLKNPKYFKEVADSVVKRGYCVNETLTVVEHDTDTIVEVKVKHDSAFVRSLQFVVDFDTTLTTGARIQIHKGKLTVSCPQKTKTVTNYKTITQTVRDKKLEEILKAENQALLERIKAKEIECKERDVKIGELKNKVASLTIKIYLFIIAIVLYVLYQLYGRFKFFK